MNDADLLKQASGLFEKLGKTLRREAERVVEPLRQPLGSIHIELDRTRFAVGETVSGRVVLDLDKPVVAERLDVTFAAFLRATAFERREVQCNHLRAKHDETVQRDVVSFSWPISAEKLAKVRDAASHQRFAPADVLRGLTSLFDRELTWKIVASLIVPSARPLTTSIDVEIDG
ncbi:MAG TPA: hypothetical protein VH143_09975 [Kofleriaceae bacterium]|nr:hypothetical protein [Kofleriaceae bacterium]